MATKTTCDDCGKEINKHPGHPMVHARRKLGDILIVRNFYMTPAVRQDICDDCIQAWTTAIKEAINASHA